MSDFSYIMGKDRGIYIYNYYYVVDLLKLKGYIVINILFVFLINDHIFLTQS